MTITTRQRIIRNTKLRARIAAARILHAALHRLTKAWAARYWAARNRRDQEGMIHASHMLDMVRQQHERLVELTVDLRWDIGLAELEDGRTTIAQRLIDDVRDAR